MMYLVAMSLPDCAQHILFSDILLDILRLLSGMFLMFLYLRF